MNSLNNKGQESAPFELLIAVIIMGFVIFVGMHAMGQLKTEQCEGQIEKMLEDFKTKLEITVNNRSPQNINFSLPACYSSNTETIEITEHGDARLCAAYCGAAKDYCLLLRYTGPAFSIRSCLNISPGTAFPGPGGSDTKCPAELEDFPDASLVELRNPAGFPEGRYLFINKTSGLDAFPTVCAYKK